MKKFVLTYSVILLVVLVGIPTQALEPLVLYDDFNAKRIDPDKWFGGGGGLEVIRKIQSRKLRLANRSYGETDSDSGSVTSVLFLNFPNPSAVTAIEATVRVRKFAATGCPGNPSATHVFAELSGNFFNTDTPTPDSPENNVGAAINVIGSSGSAGLRVTAGVWRVFNCSDEGCDEESLGSHDLGSIKRRQKKVRLRIQWDPDNDRFIFQRDDEPEVLSPYMVSDTAPPSFEHKQLGIFTEPANCTTEPRPTGFIEAVFDDVFVNESAVP